MNICEVRCGASDSFNRRAPGREWRTNIHIAWQCVIDALPDLETGQMNWRLPKQSSHSTDMRPWVCIARGFIWIWSKFIEHRMFYEHFVPQISPAMTMFKNERFCSQGREIFSPVEEIKNTSVIRTSDFGDNPQSISFGTQNSTDCPYISSVGMSQLVEQTWFGMTASCDREFQLQQSAEILRPWSIIYSWVPWCGVWSMKPSSVTRIGTLTFLRSPDSSATE